MHARPIPILTILLAVLLPSVATSGPWRVVLPDTVVVSGGTALLRDVATGPVPAAAGRVVLHAGAEPNTAVGVSRQFVLRRLVSAGLGAGVAFGGADRCVVVFAGRELDAASLTEGIRRELQSLVPPAVPGAPDSWLELDVPGLRLAATGDWRIEAGRRERLAPGRNLVPVTMVSGRHSESFTVSVVLHAYDETARAVRAVPRDMPLAESHFSWEWRDLAELDNGVVAGRTAVAGASATRSIAAGDLLRVADLKETPVIRTGDAVELLVMRGQVAVTVRATARQAGCLGQTIPVRSELTGRLVNARVAGPGLVEWRR